MSSEKFQRFGKYLILDHLVDGGMAKICRANYLGEQANKIVAIKMVQPQYSKNPSFVQMFEDELKVTFGLLHPNIAQVYDYGMVDEQLYSAMEYVDGANLKQFLDRLKQKKFVFPVEISTYIISQVSQALHYAHTFQDKLTGKPFNIIHRDISPHNIMLTYDGSVKVIDFGIAKADSNSESTQAGTIKGKLSYLAPEYLEGLELDHRYDQFAVGITLWEMLCSRKLFTAKNDLAVLKQIQSCKVPKPSSINPNVPAELDDIVLRALSKDRSKRFENMDKLNRALVKFLYSNYPEFNATDLSYFAKQLFKEEIALDKKKFVDFGKIDLKPYLQALQNTENGGQVNSNPAREKAPDGSFISEEQRTGKIELDLGTFDEKEGSIPNLDLDFSETTAIGIKSKATSNATKKIKKKTPATRGDKTNLRNVRNSSGSNKTSRTRIRSGHGSRGKKNTVLATDKGGGSSILPTLVVASLVMFAVFNPALVKKYTGFGSTDKGERDPAAKNGVITTEGESKKLGTLTITNLETDMQVLLNGSPASFNGISTKISLDEVYTLTVSKTGFKKWTYDEEITLSKGNVFISIQVPELMKDSVGFLTSSQNFSPGSKIKFSIDGEEVVKDLPLTNERVPAGTYDGVITNTVLGTERNIRFTVEENKRNFLK
ncbi:MAG: serine/threonine-protein kinase [Bacteriovoracaceae bacterium]|jgi:serine/threonine protein kinase